MPEPSQRVAEGFPHQRLTVLPAPVLRRARQLPIVRDLCVTHIGSFAPAPSHFIQRESGAAQFVLIVCLMGAGTCSLDGRSWPLSTGDAVILPPAHPHHYQSGTRDPWTIFWIHFTGTQAEHYARAIEATPERPTFHLQRLSRLTDAFEETYRHVLGGFTDADLLGLTTSLARLLGLCRLHQRSPTLKRREGEDRVLAAIRHMEAHFAAPLTLADLAAVAGCSPPHFSALFKRQVNLPPIEYLTRLRLRHAAEFLKFSNLGVQEIAFAVGYEDPFYFSRRFRLHMGVSPSAYRAAFTA